MKKATIRNPYAKRPRPSVVAPPPMPLPDGAISRTAASAASAVKVDDKMPGDETSNNEAPALSKKIASSLFSGAVSSTNIPNELLSNKSHDGAPTKTNEAASTASALVIAASDKAGMDGIDREKINQIILRESGNSLFIQQQRKRDEKVNERIADLKEKLAQALPGCFQDLTQQLDLEEPGILAQRPTRSTAVVVDMDSYYMSCELLSRPDLKDRPACVGRGMILTSNYKARTYGVRSAMAGWIGDKLVEELSEGRERLIHVPSNFPLYKEKSQIVRRVLADYDPQMRAYSLDEVYMDLAPYLALKLTKGWSHEQISTALSERKAEENTKEASGWTESQATLASFSPSKCLEAARQVLESMRQAVYDATGGLVSRGREISLNVIGCKAPCMHGHGLRVGECLVVWKKQ
eukprot:scaffold41089_cov176-Amphora_coffeaeformis.AAC.1